MNRAQKPVGILLLAALVLGLGGCGVSKDEILDVIAPTATPQPEATAVVSGPGEETELPPAEENCEMFSGCFSPFWAESDGDKLVVAATQLSLLAAEGEESPSIISRALNDDGSITVSIEIRSGLRFSDGTPIDADDLLFTYYALLDPDYSGPAEVNTLPIRGLEEYLSGVPAALFEKYGAEYDEIYADGTYDEALQKALKEAKEAQPHNSWDEQQAQKAVDEYETEKAELIRQTIRDYWRRDVDELVEFCMEKFGNTVEYHTGYTLEQVRADERLQVMYAMVEWNYATLTANGILVANKSGTSWDLQTQFPTADDFFAELQESYGDHPETYWQIEGVGRRSMLEQARNAVIAQWAAEDKDWTGPVTRISGIERVGDRLITVTLDYYDATFVEKLCGVYLTPLHWYGDESLYDYGAGSYGFPFGDLSALRENNATPLGGGAYVLDSFADNRASLSANAAYWGAAPENPRLEIFVEY